MSEPIFLSAMNTKMFDLNLTDSDSQIENQGHTNQKLTNSNPCYSNSKKPAQSSFLSKNTDPEQSNYQLKLIPNLTVKTSPLFNFKPKKQHLPNNTHIFTDPTQQKSQKNPIKSQNKPLFSAKIKRLSANRNEKGVKKQQKNIQFLNDSIIMQDIEEIKFSPSITKKQSINPQINDNQFKTLNIDCQSPDHTLPNIHQSKEPSKCLNSKSQQATYQKQNQGSESQNSNQDRETKNYQSEEIQSISNKLNYKCILNYAQINKTKVGYHDFRSSENSENLNKYLLWQSLLGSQKHLQQPVLTHGFTLFSSKFRTQQYQSLRDHVFALLLNSENCSPQKSSENIKKLLTTSIPTSHMFEFEVHVYKDLFKTQFQLWVKYNSQNQKETVMIASACNSSFHIDKSIFVMEQVNYLNERQFIGQLESNFTRSFYTLIGFGSCAVDNNESIRDGPTNLQAKEIQVKELLNISFNIYRTVYIPKLIQESQFGNEVEHNENKRQNENLQERYRREKYQQKQDQEQEYSVKKLVTSKEIQKLGEIFYLENGIRKSNKTLLIVDGQTMGQGIFIGKIASKKYKLMVGPGFSPLQAFGITVAHVESN